ncbi:hypothetical protein PPEP_b0538 [Pseudoalteromonas peptidolytica F12-50-A1]|uniref:Uncharacterized protein n=1 Tax=Pseudoalteromonas peptidolytica F12-50-A1 TaxID=1315280 RepID=A0A8I0T6V5_9GAMM|nr:hypothetical protein [Pseudoalteromonas peptidolytica F12-50-A1]
MASDLLLQIELILGQISIKTGEHANTISTFTNFVFTKSVVAIILIK